MSLVQPITPHLWFDTQAREAAEFYCSVFPESSIDSLVRLHDTPSGDCDVVSFTLWGQPFMAISAGPLFRFNPSISFLLDFDATRMPDARARLDRLWATLFEGGDALMPLGAYPFSPRYGWVTDRFGLSWQLNLRDSEGAPRPPLSPALMFTGVQCGRAEAAGSYYRGVFPDSCAGQLVRHPEGGTVDRPGTVLYSDFRLDRTWFVASDSGQAHGFGFNEAISFMVVCRDQAELDRYWAQLSHVPEAEQCGWCKDRFGVSWQVAPKLLGDLMRTADRTVVDRVTRAFLPMKKLDVGRIEAAGRV